MPEFLQLLSPTGALARLFDALLVQPGTEEVETRYAARRVTATAVQSPHPLPAFPRSTVDGFAVRAQDTFGASEGLPAYLQMVVEIPMGSAAAVSLKPGECALIHTGGMLPGAADAVVMLENTQPFANRGGLPNIEIYRPAAVGENVLKIGEDVGQGEEVISPGTVLRPAHIGGLMALGLLRVKVARRPKVALISTGDEVVSPEVEPSAGQVRDVNTHTLSALVEEVGGQAVEYGIIPDQADALHSAAARALGECDVVVITAGSSASTRDLTAQVIQELGAPGVLVHGVNVRPGKPTILAVCGSKAVLGLPGNPVSALVIAKLFLVPVIQALLGVRNPRPRPSVQARLALNLPSQAGREDYIPVQLVGKPGDYQAEPVFGKSNLIFSLARADGLVRIPADATGLAAGEWVEVEIL